MTESLAKVTIDNNLYDIMYYRAHIHSRFKILHIPDHYEFSQVLLASRTRKKCLFDAHDLYVPNYPTARKMYEWQIRFVFFLIYKLNSWEEQLATWSFIRPTRRLTNITILTSLPSSNSQKPTGELGSRNSFQIRWALPQ